MKKVGSQIVVAAVCALLGFLLAYQFKLLNKGTTSVQNTDIIEEINSLKIEKEELLATNKSISDELKALEEAAAKEGEVEAKVKNELDVARMRLGLADVKGPGGEIIITPKNNIFGNSSSDTIKDITENELVYLVNLLWYARCEAISINDIRITPQMGIKNSGPYVVANTDKIDPKKEIVIKVIGDKGKIKAALDFSGTLTYGALAYYKVELKTSDEVIINKSTQSLSMEFLKPVETSEKEAQ